jgi:hypothetical protein
MAPVRRSGEGGYLGREGERSGSTNPLWGVPGGTGGNRQRHADPQGRLREENGVSRWRAAGIVGHLGEAPPSHGQFALFAMFRTAGFLGVFMIVGQPRRI